MRNGPVTNPTKRTYRVDFDPYVLMCIQGAKEGVYACYGWHDLLDHSHNDIQFMMLDPASRGYIEAVKIYEKKYDAMVSRTKTKLFKEASINGKDLSKQIYTLEKLRDAQRDRANKASTKAEAKRIRKEPNGLVEIQENLSKLRNIQTDIENQAYKITHQKMGNRPEPESYWQPIFDRMCWQFDYISFNVPTWIEERSYTIVKQEVHEVEHITKLERIEPKGSGINWKSRNRGGKVVVSSKGFEKVASKIYPTHLKND